MSDNPFWDYSLKLYRRSGVAPLCIDLQDRCGANVNLLLFACWVGNLGRQLDEDQLRAAAAEISDWNNRVTQPLRTRRRAIDRAARGAAQEKQRLLAAELDAEREEQIRLLNWYEAHCLSLAASPQEAAIAQNLQRYLAVLGARGELPQLLVTAAALDG